MIRFTGPFGLNEPIAELRMYTDGTPLVKTQGWDRIVNKADTMVVQPISMTEFVTAMFLAESVVDAKFDAGATPLSRLVLPYLPGARQDRINPTGDVLFTARSVARMINRVGFERVVTLDPHSRVMPSFCSEMVEYPLSRVAQFLPGGHTVIAPDAGAVLRANEVASAIGSNVICATKERDVSNGKLSNFSVDVEPGNHYLVVDDICDGGGTFLGLGEKIKEQGATADLYVSHGIFSKGTDELRRYYENIYTTNSFVGNREGVRVIPVMKDMETY